MSNAEQSSKVELADESQLLHFCRRWRTSHNSCTNKQRPFRTQVRRQLIIWPIKLSELLRTPTIFIVKRLRPSGPQFFKKKNFKCWRVVSNTKSLFGLQLQISSTHLLVPGWNGLTFNRQMIPGTSVDRRAVGSPFHGNNCFMTNMFGNYKCARKTNGHSWFKKFGLRASSSHANSCRCICP